MNGRERITRILKHQPVDRIGLFEHFWNDTCIAWREQGHLSEDESYEDHFGYDMQICNPFNFIADLSFKPQIVGETDDTLTVLDGNGAILRKHKHHDTTPEHVGFQVTDRYSWEKNIKPFLITGDYHSRINFKEYKRAKRQAADRGRFFAVSCHNAFANIFPVCGHEYMLAGMALDPEWIVEMAETYANLIISMQNELFKREGFPDGVWFYEDMGFKSKPFMSPSMYRKIIKPSHTRTISFAKNNRLPVIMHSCGYIEPLLPDMIEAGIDCLQVIEVKAGMDLIKLHRLYGSKIAFMGGIDIRTLCTNDRDSIDRELEQKIPIVKNGYGYVLHSDHSIPDTVKYETYRYFIERGLELGKY